MADSKKRLDNPICLWYNKEIDDRPGYCSGCHSCVTPCERNEMNYQERIRGYYPKDRSNRADQAAICEEMIEAALGLAGEAGETVDIIKKHVFYRKDIVKNDLKLELGDTLHYLARLADIFGWTLEELMDANEDKLDARYPNGYSNKDAINKTEIK
jgi:NTP pyrophosphatase (non-canonical NTP hydrolase)